MAKSSYIGINNIARKITKSYFGVDNIARKIKKAYIGINGIARLYFSNEVSYQGEFGKRYYDILGMASNSDYGFIYSQYSGQTGYGANHMYTLNKSATQGYATNPSLKRTAFSSLSTFSNAWFAGGTYSSDGYYDAIKSVPVYDVNNTLTYAPSLTQGRDYCSLAYVNNKVLIAGGYYRQEGDYGDDYVYDDRYLKTVEVYDNTSLTKYANATNLHIAYTGSNGITVEMSTNISSTFKFKTLGECAIFSLPAGVDNKLDIYTSSLTRMTITIPNKIYKISSSNIISILYGESYNYYLDINGTINAITNSICNENSACIYSNNHFIISSNNRSAYIYNNALQCEKILNLDTSSSYQSGSTSAIKVGDFVMLSQYYVQYGYIILT